MNKIKKTGVVLALCRFVPLAGDALGHHGSAHSRTLAENAAEGGDSSALHLKIQHAGLPQISKVCIQMRGAVAAVAGAALAGVEGGAGAAGADMVAQPQIFAGLHQCQHHLIGRGGGIFVPDIQVGGAIQPDVGIVDD